MSFDVKSFGNEQAKDWLQTLYRALNTEPVKLALLAVLRTNKFIDAQDAEIAVAAAEIVAAAMGKGCRELPADAAMWIRAHKFVPSKEMLKLSVLVVDRIEKNSELRDLWEGTEHGSEWRRAMADLKSRLLLALETSQEEVVRTRAKEEQDSRIIDVNSLFDNAVSLVSEGRHHDAIAKYHQIIGLDPSCVVAYIGRGTSYLALGEFEDALEDLNSAIDLEPEVAEAYYLRAQAYFQLGNFGRTIADLTILLNMNPGRTDAYLMRGLANMSLNRQERAIKDFTITLEFDPENANAYLYRSKAYEKEGRFDLAGRDRKQYERLTGQSRRI